MGSCSDTKRAERLSELAIDVWAIPKLSEDVLARYRTVVERGTGYVLADFPQLEEGTHIRVLLTAFLMPL